MVVFKNHVLTKLHGLSVISTCFIKTTTVPVPKKSTISGLQFVHRANKSTIYANTQILHTAFN